MTRIKFCGLTHIEDIKAVNDLKPEFIGFVFWPKSKRVVTREQASELKAVLDPSIKAVGVFVDEDTDIVKALLNDDIIDIAQLHGSEDEAYINELKSKSGKQVIKAFKITSAEDIEAARRSPADYVLLDSGTGTGQTFDHSLIRDIDRPIFLAGGLTPGNVAETINEYSPFAVDASSSLETNGKKDKNKMTAFVNAVRGKER